MEKDQSNSGSLIITVIVIGVAYVSFCMFTQAPADSPSQIPPMPPMSQAAKNYLSPDKDPYVAALLAPDTSASLAAVEKDRFSLLMQEKLHEFDNKRHHVDLRPSTLRSDLLDNDANFAGKMIEGRPQAGVSAPSSGGGSSRPPTPSRPPSPSSAPVQQSVPPPASMTGGGRPPVATARAYMSAPPVNAADSHINELLGKIDAAYQQGDSELGMKKLHEALNFQSQQVHPEVSDKCRINVFLAGARLTHQMHNNDQSRSYVSQAIALSHQYQDYRMGDLEGVRCLLDGNSNDAAHFNLLFSDFQQSLSQSDFKRLPQLADSLVDATKSLPNDCFFRLRAIQSKAMAMLMAGRDSKDIEKAINQAEAAARKSNDMTIVASCEDLMVRLKSE